VPLNQTVVLGETIELEVKILSDAEFTTMWVKHEKDQQTNIMPVQVSSSLKIRITPSLSLALMSLK